jgi:glutaredoxin
MKSMKTFLIIVIFVACAAIGIVIAKNVSDKNTENAVNTNEESEDNGDIAGTTTQNEAKQPNAEEIYVADFIFFYGETCPHCQDVEEFLNENNVDEQINLVRLEVYSNQENQTLMAQKLEGCSDIDEDSKGAVPFLYSKDKCLVGSTPIIEHLKEITGIN